MVSVYNSVQIFYLHIRGFEQQVAEWCVAGRWQHRVFYVGQLQTQGSQIIRLGLAAVSFRLEEIPVERHRITVLWSVYKTVQYEY